ncbi:MAG: YebC/PmpR family DNA-binding transcriptional regulator [Candidatus Dojkabacteria bacterium]
MAGHSKWAKLKHTKGLVDAKKGALLSKISKDIITSVKVGGSSDPNFNPMLRLAISKAKEANMTNDRIERAVKRGLGGTSSGDDVISENTYEAYGPGGFSILIDTESDNSNRTLTDIKTIINKNGGKMANEGSISWQFSEVGFINIEGDSTKIQTLEENLLDIQGIEDIESEQTEDTASVVLIIDKNLFRDAYSKIVEVASNMNAKIMEAKLIMQTKNLLELREEDLSRAESLIEKIEEVSEVTNVWTNIQ